MTDEHLATVPNMLEESGPGFLTMSMDSDDYFDVLRAVMRHSEASGKTTIFVSASMAEHSLRCTMERLEEPMGHVKVIDCVSDMLMSPKSGMSRYVESPRLLEMVLLEIERALRASSSEAMIIIDSINALSIHNSKAKTMALLEALYNRVNISDHTLVLLHLGKSDEGISLSELRMISDRILIVE